MTNVGPSEAHVWCVSLPSEPQLYSELALLEDKIARVDNVSLVLDLSRVEIISSPSLGRLLCLHQLVSRGGNRLILCQMQLATKCILRISGLETTFEFAQSKAEALGVLRRTRQGSVESLQQDGGKP